MRSIFLHSPGPILTATILTFATVAPGSLPAASSKEAAAYFPPADAAGGWRAATNAATMRERAGMEPDRLEQSWEFTQRCTQNGGLLVVHNGWLVFERYFGRAGRNVNPDMASTGKAYT